MTENEDATRSASATTAEPRGGRKVLVLVGLVAACLAVGALGALATGPAVRGWYPTIQKPPLNPPAWVFGPTWTALYVLMGWAAYRAWRRRGWLSRALALFGVQLLLNAAWSPVFFGLRQIGWAVVVIVSLWIAILLTLVEFWRTDRLAGGLLVPYLAWVSFATYLNVAIWRLNPLSG